MSDMTNPPRFSRLERYKLSIMLNYLMFFLAGVPIWWVTTAVYRASLPFGSIRSSQPGHLFNTMNLHMNSLDYYLLVDQSIMNSSVLADRLNTMPMDDHCILDNLHSPFEVAYSRSFYAVSSPDEFPDAAGSYLIAVQRSSVPYDTHASIMSSRHIVILAGSEYADDQHELERLINDLVLTIRKLEIKHLMEFMMPSSLAGSASSMRIVDYSPKYHVSYSLFNGDSDNRIYQWNFDSVQDRLNVFFERLSPFASFSSSVQIREFAGLNVRPERMINRGNVIHPRELPMLVNTAQWDLSSSLVNHTELNFIVYVPNRIFRPLFITEDNGDNNPFNAITMPRSGGLAIVNVDDEEMLNADLSRIASIWLQQMRDLLGIFDLLSSDFARAFEKDHGVTIEIEKSEFGITDWEYDSLLRRRTVENTYKSIDSLEALDRMLQKLQNMNIEDHIQRLVTESLNYLEMVHRLLSSTQISNSLAKAFEASKLSLNKSESAFFDNTMTSLLYFPDEHLMAVYLPFFFPVAVPYLASIVKHIKGQ